MATASAQGERELALACFRVGERAIALDLAALRGVVRWQPATPLPGAPALIEGVIELRGGMVPVVDLGRVLGGEPVRGGPRARVAVAEVEGLLLGLAVDAALQVSQAPAAALLAPPEVATRSGRALGRALWRRPAAEPVLVLSLEAVLERVRGSDPIPAREASA
jgi:purine-binding chemotaxis protein CheW